MVFKDYKNYINNEIIKCSIAMYILLLPICFVAYDAGPILVSSFLFPIILIIGLFFRFRKYIVLQKNRHQLIDSNISYIHIDSYKKYTRRGEYGYTIYYKINNKSLKLKFDSKFINFSNEECYINPLYKNYAPHYPESNFIMLADLEIHLPEKCKDY